MLRAILIFVDAIAPSRALAQGSQPTPTMRLDQYALEAFTVDDGLPSDFLQAGAQTPDGYLWIGTSNGLVRFDGFEFNVFNGGNMPALVNDDVEALAVTPDGSLWVASAEGHLLRLRDGTTTTFAGDNGAVVLGTCFFARRCAFRCLQIIDDGIDIRVGQVCKRRHDTAFAVQYFGRVDTQQDAVIACGLPVRCFHHQSVVIGRFGDWKFNLG